MTTNREHELYRKGLEKTRGSIWGRIRSVFSGRISLGEEELEKIEEILITADVGFEYTTRFIDHLRSSSGSVQTDADLKTFMSRWITGVVAGAGTRSLEST